MTESATDVRIVEKTPAYWRVVFDYPPFNIVDATIFEGLQHLLARMDASPNLRVVVFESANPEFYLAHFDLTGKTGNITTADRRRSYRFLEKLGGRTMKFGTIGAGTVALAFAREALATGHQVVLSSRRGPESLASKITELGRGAFAATVEEAASLDYVLLAVPWPNVEDALRGLPAWNGRVLI